MSIKIFKSRTKVFIKLFSDLIFCFFILSNIFFDNIMNFIFVVSLWIPINYIIGFYNIEINLKKSNILSNIFVFTFSGLILYSTIFFLRLSYDIEQNNLFLKVISILILVLLRNFILRKISENIHSTKFVIINDKNFINKITQDNVDTDQLEKFFFINTDSLAEIKHLNLKNINGIIFDDSISEDDKNNILKMNKDGLNLYNKSNWCEKYLQRIPIEFSSKKFADSFYNKDKKQIHYRLKRIADIYLSIFILLITSPIIFLSMILIFIEDKGNFFYSQTRTGLYGKKFKITKIRTMIMNAESDGAQWSKKKDIRITKIGKYLRLTRIDELPQLISVIKGHMSLVGPRPERPEIDKMLIKKIPNYNLRYLTPPGLSGWAQVNYPYGASVEDSRNKLSFDIFYLKNQSIFLDFLIFLKTIKLILNAQGSIAKD